MEPIQNVELEDIPQASATKAELKTKKSEPIVMLTTS